jgi:hypothetical protein
LVIVLCGVIFLAAASANLWEYLAERRLAVFERQNSALSHSTDARLFEEARMLAAQSPELAAEMARRMGRPDLILFPSRQGRRALIRLAGSEVTLQFALKVLNLSDDLNMAAMRNFSDNTYLYDPNREIPDRQQWKQFNWILAQEGMVTRYVPNEATNSAPMWVPPWTPARVADNWLLPKDMLSIFEPYMLEETVEA